MYITKIIYFEPTRTNVRASPEAVALLVQYDQTGILLFSALVLFTDKLSVSLFFFSFDDRALTHRSRNNHMADPQEAVWKACSTESQELLECKKGAARGTLRSWPRNLLTIF
jgi:uncharacterized protein